MRKKKITKFFRQSGVHTLMQYDCPQNPYPFFFYQNLTIILCSVISDKIISQQLTCPTISCPGVNGTSAISSATVGKKNRSGTK